MRGGRLNSYDEVRVLEDLDMARRSIGPGAAEHFGRVDDVGAIVVAEEINHLDGRVLCQEQRAASKAKQQRLHAAQCACRVREPHSHERARLHLDTTT